jgi:hypothetical protein
MRVNGSGNLFVTLQAGSDAQYEVQTTGTTTAYPSITTSFGAFWTAQTISSVVPPTATKITTSLIATLTVSASSGATASIGVGPNPNFGSSTVASPQPPCGAYLQVNLAGENIVQAVNQLCTLVLESATSLFTGQSTVTGGTLTNTNLLAVGWKEKVNAN